MNVEITLCASWEIKLTLILGSGILSEYEAIPKAVWMSNSVGIPSGKPMEAYLCSACSLLWSVCKKNNF